MVLLSQRMKSQCRFYRNTVSNDDIYHKIVPYQTRERMFYVILGSLSNNYDDGSEKNWKGVDFKVDFNLTG